MNYGKMIELLNEYNCKVLRHTDKWKEKDGKLIMEIDYNHSRSFNTDLYIVSLRYGFIKWLVENDKINLNKLKKIGYEKTVCVYDGQYREIVEYSAYESLLMLLSIQEEPVSFLISLLK